MIRVAVAGASGRMGRMLIEAVGASDDMQMAGAIDVAQAPSIGQDASAFLGHSSGVPIESDLRRGLAQAQVLIDFTRPEGTLAHLAVLVISCSNLPRRWAISSSRCSRKSYHGGSMAK